jgi:16S rRNA (adenine1518-N6/adenine1519-N6)-dimethyltransferase
MGGTGQLVSNLPYSIATPLVAQCLLHSWRAVCGPAPRATEKQSGRFDSLTFTVQREVADRMAAPSGQEAYGPISVLVALLGRVTAGPNVPAESFWPRPKVASRILRIDFDPAAAGAVANADGLAGLLHLAFNQRRKQIGSMVRREGLPYGAEDVRAALEAAGIDPTVRCERVTPGQYLAMANTLAAKHPRAERAGPTEAGVPLEGGTNPLDCD